VNLRVNTATCEEDVCGDWVKKGLLRVVLSAGPGAQSYEYEGPVSRIVILAGDHSTLDFQTMEHLGRTIECFKRLSFGTLRSTW